MNMINVIIFLADIMTRFVSYKIAQNRKHNFFSCLDGDKPNQLNHDTTL